MPSSDVNYDESKIPPYTLPELLVCADGSKVTSTKIWETKRRPELLKIFETQMFGAAPNLKVPVRYSVVEASRAALKGKATRRQVRMTLSRKGAELAINLLMYLPNNVTKKGIFVGLNFNGNHTVLVDPSIHDWTDDSKPVIPHGQNASNWCVEQIISAGYGIATVFYQDIDPDYDDRFKNGVHGLFPELIRNDESWGSIAAWAWGLQRVADYLLADPDLKGLKLILMGHSRLGKAALWAGALDARFSAVISNDSGCGGAALSRRCFGETLRHINTSFPHWFCANFKQYNNKESKLPIDQHQQLALIAPRPLLVGSAQEDRWADPKGEFLSAYHAGPAYNLYGCTTLTSDTMPNPSEDSLTDSLVSYRIRPGGHDVRPDDWDAFIRFADAHLVR